MCVLEVVGGEDFVRNSAILIAIYIFAAFGTNQKLCEASGTLQRARDRLLASCLAEALPPQSPCAFQNQGDQPKCDPQNLHEHIDSKSGYNAMYSRPME